MMDGFVEDATWGRETALKTNYLQSLPLSYHNILHLVTLIVHEWHWYNSSGCIHPYRILFGEYFYKDSYNLPIIPMSFKNNRSN